MLPTLSQSVSPTFPPTALRAGLTMIPTSNDLPHAVSCQICNDNLNVNGGQSSQREVVRTSCNTPHCYHLECIAPIFDALLHAERRCHVCKQQPLPLVRQSGTRLNETSPYCESRASYACRIGDMVLLRRLLTQDPEMATRKCTYPTEPGETTLLSIAASFGQVECLRALINQGSKERLELNTPLAYAAKYGHTECVKLLFNEGAAEINVALNCACEGGHGECAEFLIENGANVFRDALFSCTKKGHTECMKVLFKGVRSFNASQLNECLKSAVFFNRPDTLRLLIDNGANDLNGALLSAVVRDNSECARILLLNGANSSSDMLCRAAASGHIECLKLLMDNNNHDLHAPLALAKKQNHIECEQILREKINSQQMSCTIL